MGECVDDSGRLGNCPNERLSLLAVVAVTGSLCLLITWTTNRMAGTLAERGRSAGWAVLGGFVLAAVLALSLYALLIILT